MAFWVKNLPGKQETQETQVRSLGWEGTLEKEMATHSSILAWKISWTEEFGGLQSKGCQRVGKEGVTTHTVRKTKSKADCVKPGLCNTDKNGRKHMEHRQKWKWQVKGGENKGHGSRWRGPFIRAGGTVGGCSYLETVKQGLRYKWWSEVKDKMRWVSKCSSQPWGRFSWQKSAHSLPLFPLISTLFFMLVTLIAAKSFSCSSLVLSPFAPPTSL